MLTYVFQCPHCNASHGFSDRETILNFIRNSTVTCPSCGEESPYDPKYTATNNYFYATGLGWVLPEDDPRHTDELPHPDDMEVDTINLKDCTDWQREILKEFNNAYGVREDNDYDLQEALTGVKSHQFGWAKFGAWAFQFKLKRLYKNTHKTWKEFCEKVLHLGCAYVDKKIKAARVLKDLICAGFDVLPQNEYQCRFLTKFWGDELIEKWQMILNVVKPHLITGDLLKASFCSREPKEEKWVKIDSQLWEEFEYKAHSRGLNPNQVIEDYLEEWEGEENEEITDELDDDEVEDVPTEKLEAWQDDLQALIEEKDRSDNWFTKLIFWSLANDRKMQSYGIP